MRVLLDTHALLWRSSSAGSRLSDSARGPLITTSAAETTLTRTWDRLLIAQAQVEGLPIVTADPAIARYDVEVIW